MAATASTAPQLVANNPAVATLRTRWQGTLLSPDDPEYDGARQVFNAMIDRRPALIARPRGVEDIRRAIHFAREHDLLLSVKGGGHNVAGSAVCEGGLMLDLSQLKGIHVDPERRIAVALPGVILGELDRATQKLGLATPLGTVSVTGIAGLTLGGGIGWLNGKHGLACDNLIAADVVTADGSVLHASAAENADLFWALRGGSGNFGVVTSFVYRLYPVSRLLTGTLVFSPEQTRQALHLYDDFARACPDELSTLANLSTDDEGRTVMSVTYCWCGPVGEGERVLHPLRSFGPPVEDVIETMDYCDLQQIIDPRFPPGRQHYWKSSFLSQLSDEAIDVMLQFAAERPSPAHVYSAEGKSRAAIALQHVHGAAARVDPAATAFAHRHDHYDFLLFAQWTDPADADRHIAWARAFFAAMRPFTDRAVYVNGLGEDDKDRVREAYGANYDRLAALKARYDPINLFRSNQNVVPAG